MAYQFQLTEVFIKHYKKLTSKEQILVDAKLRLLAENPWYPSLRIKRIQGTKEFEVSVNMDIRMAISFEADRIIIMLDIGHHDTLLNRRSRK